MPPFLSRSLVLFIACAIFFQLILFLNNLPSSSSSSSSSRLGHHSAEHHPLASESEAHHYWSAASHSSPNDPVKNRHPTVPLSLKDLELLDKLADTIATTEAYRVFENKELGRIRGSRSFSIKDDDNDDNDNYNNNNDSNNNNNNNNPSLVRQIRDQIHCWTNYGSWQRQDKQFTLIKHLGDPRFTKCDKTFTRALDREDNGHYLGEYDHLHDRLLVREAVKYKWVPDAICGPGSGPTNMGLEDTRAHYQPFTRTEFCQVIGNRDLLLAGDITQYQLHDVILSAFKSTFICYGELGCLHRHAHDLCPTVGIKYAWNDILSVPWAINPEEEEYPSASTIEQPWATPEMLQKFKVLILNRGLIWRPDQVFLNELVFTMKHIWTNSPDTLVIYRATHPISPNCTLFKQKGEDEAIADQFGFKSVIKGTILQRPLDRPPERQEIHSTEKPEYRPTLADIQRQNRMAKIVVEAAGGIFLDTEAMFAKRPDGRMGEGDCARFCAPGPLDAYADLLFNTFRILQA